ncbi:hypothetical protein [Pragia fontium]|uniref:hypothetical protein n=1 Tax=Pragia fontium TaxID=82985 RepID=UPI00064AB0B5|nr:hypothetical protein [Pragia fontium]AKJ43766.1 hypothetical protein QQ39_05090 [Pragia fontium]
MPSVFCPEDGNWIQEELLKLRPTVRRKAAVKYAEVYQGAFDAEEVSFKQVNAARHEANTRLRLFVEKFADASDGLCKPAPVFKER